MTDLAGLVERTRGQLQQYVNERPIMCTYEEETDAGFLIRPIQGSGALGGSFLAELDWELIQVEGFNPETNLATVPPWGRAQLGTSVGDPQTGKRIVVNPLWPYWHTAEALIAAMNDLYPSLFVIKNIELSTSVLKEKYELPNDVDEILDIRVEWWPPVEEERRIRTFSVDKSNVDEKTYLHMPAPGISGRPLKISYRALPELPTGPTDQDWEWETSGFPLSAVDLPTLRAASGLILSTETARLNNYSAPQSDRNRFVQGGAASAISRRLEEMYQTRLKVERDKLRALHPVRLRREWNG